MRICMFVYNNCTRDMRVLKEAGSLRDAGHEVRILAVLDATTAPEEARDGIRITRIDRNPIHYRLLRRVRQVKRIGRHLAYWSVRALALVGVLAGPADRLAGDLRARRRIPGPLVPFALLVFPLLWVPRFARRLAAAGEARAEAARTTSDAAAAGAGRRALLKVHKPLMFTDYYRRALRVTAAAPADAYHAHDLHTLPAAALAARRDGARLVYDAHELYPEISTLSKRERRVWQMVERALIGRADRVITVCESIAGELSTRYGVAAPTVVLNAPPRPASVPDRAVSPLRERVGLDGSEPIVLYQGGFTTNRGLPQLVRAGALLERGVIVLMGWGPLEEELQALIAREGLQRRVFLTPAVPPSEILDFAAGADIGVIPYEPVGLNNTYTTPNKLFDYIAVGLPIAASPLPELRRFVEGLGIGVLFERIDDTGIVATLNTMVADAEGMAAMREAALKAAPTLTWETEAGKLLALYAP